MVLGPILQIVVSVTLAYILIPKLGLIGIGLAVLISVAINRLFSIIMGLYFYDTGVPEIKMFMLCALCVGAAVISLFWTSLIGDVVVSVSLLAALVLIFNKDMVSVVKYLMDLLKPTRKKEDVNNVR